MRSLCVPIVLSKETDLMMQSVRELRLRVLLVFHIGAIYTAKCYRRASPNSGLYG